MHNPLNDGSAEHDMLKLTIINARLKIPHVNYAVVLRSAVQ